MIGLKPNASQLGISLGDIARQVRQAFYGEEVQRLQRGPDTLKVMVRYPIEERSSIAALENMHIRTASGHAITLILIPCLYRVIYDLRDSKRFTKPELATD